GALDENHTNRQAFAKHGCGERRLKTQTGRVSLRSAEIGIGFERIVRNMDDFSIENGPAIYEVAADRQDLESRQCWKRSPQGCEFKSIVNNAKDCHRIPIAQ